MPLTDYFGGYAGGVPDWLLNLLGQGGPQPDQSFTPPTRPGGGVTFTGNALPQGPPGYLGSTSAAPPAPPPLPDWSQGWQAPPAGPPPMPARPFTPTPQRPYDPGGSAADWLGLKTPMPARPFTPTPQRRPYDPGGTPADWLGLKPPGSAPGRATAAAPPFTTLQYNVPGSPFAGRTTGPQAPIITALDLQRLFQRRT
jgi:hypothetical protein